VTCSGCEPTLRVDISVTLTYFVDASRNLSASPTAAEPGDNEDQVTNTWTLQVQGERLEIYCALISIRLKQFPTLRRICGFKIIWFRVFERTAIVQGLRVQDME
jgi:hypothetical protein